METLNLAAHPDDIEAVLGNAVTPSDYALVATKGEGTTVNYRSDEQFIAKGGRVGESEAGLSRLGVLQSRQYYLDFPDGDLKSFIPELVNEILRIVKSNEQITHLRTLGERGVDGHPDHEAMHEAAREVQARMKEKGRYLTILAIDEQFNGTVQLLMTPERQARKLAAMACHQSQFLLWRTDEQPRSEHGIPLEDTDFIVDADWWQSFGVFQAYVLRGETYNEIT